MVKQETFSKKGSQEETLSRKENLKKKLELNIRDNPP